MHTREKEKRTCLKLYAGRVAAASCISFIPGSLIEQLVGKEHLFVPLTRCGVPILCQKNVQWNFIHTLVFVVMNQSLVGKTFRVYGG